MAGLTDNIYFQVVIIIFIILYGLYNLWKVVKVYRVHLAEKKEFITKTKGKYEKQQDYTAWVIIYALVCVGAFGMMVYNMIAKDYLMSAAYFFMGVFCISFVLDALMTRQALFEEEGFFYEKKHYRYRSVTKVVPRKSLISSYDMYLTGGESVRISRKMGDKLQDKMKEFKKRKKK